MTARHASRRFTGKPVITRPYRSLFVSCDLWPYSPTGPDMDTGVMSRSTVMFVVGIFMAVGAALGMLWSSVDVTPLTVIGIIGVVFIAVGARARRTQ